MNSLNIYFRVKIKNKKNDRKPITAVDFYLLIMSGGDSLENDPGFTGINIHVHPPSPGGQPLIKCLQTVHIFLHCISYLHIIPPEQHSQPSDFTIFYRISMI